MTARDDYAEHARNANAELAEFYGGHLGASAPTDLAAAAIEAQLATAAAVRHLADVIEAAR